MRYSVGDKILLKKSLRSGLKYPRENGVIFTESMERFKHEHMTVKSFGGVRTCYITMEGWYVTEDMIDLERTEEEYVKKSIEWLEEKLLDMRNERIGGRCHEDQRFSSVTETRGALFIDGLLKLLEELGRPREKKYRVLLKGAGEQVVYLYKKDDGGIAEGSNFSFSLFCHNKSALLTEKEIKDFDEWYWRFAEEVKETIK